MVAFYPTEKELRNENRAIASIGPKWKTTKNLYIALESINIDFRWEEKQVLDIQKMINGGMRIGELAEIHKRPENDIRVLVFEFALTGKINRLPLDF